MTLHPKEKGFNSQTKGLLAEKERIMSFDRKRRYWPVALTLFLSLLTAGCARSPEAKAAKHLQSAKALIEKHDYNRALLEARNAIQANPKSAEAYYELGLAFAGGGDLPKAVSAYRKALEVDPHHRQAQFHLAQLMAVYGDKSSTQDAESRLKGLLTDNDKAADTLNTLAFTELRLGRPDQAAEYLAQAVARFPRELGPALLLAQVKLRGGDAKGAEDTLKQLVQSAPQSIEAKALLGAFYESQKRLPEAEQVLRQALAMKSDSGLVLRLIASVDQALGKNAEAEQIYKRLSVYSEKAYQPLYALYLFQTGRKPEAVKELERLYQRDPQDRVARTRLVVAYNSVSRSADAEKVLQDALKKNPKDLDALLQRGELFLQEKQYPRAEADFNEVQHERPASPEIHYLQAKLRQTLGNTLIYRQELAEALRLNPALMAVRLELAQNFLQANAGRPALDLLNEAPASQKQLMPIIEERNWAQWSVGNLAEMRKGIDQGLTSQRTPQLLIQDGLYKLRTGDSNGARKALEEALQNDPADVLGLRALSLAYRERKEDGLAIAKVKEYAAREPKSSAVQAFLGEMLANSGDIAGARAAFNAAKTDSQANTLADLNLARLDMVQGKLDDAAHRLEAAADAGPGDSRPRLWLAVMEEKRGQTDKAIQDYRKAVESDPNQAQALNNLAYLLTEHSHNLDEALRYAQRAVELEPGKPLYAGTLGWVLYQKGLYSSALPYLETASANPDTRSAPLSAVPKYHLAMAYAKLGERQRSRATLEAALRIDAKLPEAKLAQEAQGAH